MLSKSICRIPGEQVTLLVCEQFSSNVKCASAGRNFAWKIWIYFTYCCCVGMLLIGGNSSLSAGVVSSETALCWFWGTSYSRGMVVNSWMGGEGRGWRCLWRMKSLWTETILVHQYSEHCCDLSWINLIRVRLIPPDVSLNIVSILFSAPCPYLLCTPFPPYTHTHARTH